MVQADNIIVRGNLTQVTQQSTFSSLDGLKSKWFLDFEDDGNVLNKRHPGTGLSDWTDGNKVEVLIDGKTLMEHFHSSLEKMIRFMEKNENTPNPPNIWISNLDMTNIELLGPKKGGKVYDLILKAAQKGVMVYLLHSSHFYQRIWCLGKLWKITLKKFIKKLNKENYGFASIDRRTPIRAVQHQKFYICFWPNPKDWVAVISSADFNEERWDTQKHLEVEKPSHELSVVVRGPAIRDIALTFAERWNDRANINRTAPQITTSIPTQFLYVPIPTANIGTHSVQVLRTYPIHITRRNNSALPPTSLSYSWSPHGEFTVWGAYLQAIKMAKHYIYIEDQYFGSSAALSSLGSSAKLLRDADLLYQLGKALERKVDIIILVPEEHEEKWGFKKVVNHQKLLSINYLYNIYDETHSRSKESGRLVIRTLTVSNKPVLVHSKVMIVDDEFVLVGNANIGHRSMTFDTEIHLGIVHKKGSFSRKMRLELWEEHLQLTKYESDERNPESIINKLKDPREGITIFSNDKGPGTRRLHPVEITIPTNPLYLCWQRFLGNLVIQPYAGPKRNMLG